MSYRIKTVSLATGIPTTTIRAWERRYHFITPTRNTSGYRIYSDRDIAMLARVKALVDEGLKVSEAIEVARKRVGSASAHLTEEQAIRIRSELLDSLLLLDRTGAAEVWRTLAGIPVESQIDQILLPLLVEVGRRWSENTCSIAQEHFSSAFVRERLVTMLEIHGSEPGGIRTAICAGAPGEMHEFGLLAAAIHLAMRGWRLTYLGADLPVDEIARVVERIRPKLVVSSVICARTVEECLTLAASLRAAAPEKTVIVLGGAGLPRVLPQEPSPNLYFLHSLAELFQLPRVAAL
jgi:MerR family transcriptional regulator, light-induced transcriptional regulator